MIHNLLCPSLTASQRVSLITGCRDNVCPGAVRPLNGIVPNTAGTARHEHPLISDIAIGEDTITEVSQRLSSVLELVDQLQAVNTDGVEAMSHPMKATQRLREDEVSEINQREAFQAIAPDTEEGLFLVPKVIE